MGNKMAKCSQRISWDVSSCHKLKIGAFVMRYQFYNIHALWDTFNASINIWEDLWLLSPRIKQDGINFLNIKFKSAFVKNNTLARIRIWYQEVRLVKFSIQSSQRWSKREQGKSEGFDSCDRPSNHAQILSKSSIFQPVWPWNLMYDLKK